MNCPGLEGPFTGKMSASSPANAAAATAAYDDFDEDDFHLDAEMDVDTGSEQAKGTTSQLRAMITVGCLLVVGCWLLRFWSICLTVLCVDLFWFWFFISCIWSPDI